MVSLLFNSLCLYFCVASFLLTVRAMFSVCLCVYMNTDRNRVSARRFRRGEKEVQYWDGAHNISSAVVSRWANNGTGFQHCQLHHWPTAQVWCIFNSSANLQWILICYKTNETQICCNMLLKHEQHVPLFIASRKQMSVNSFWFCNNIPCVQTIQKR